MVEMESSVLPFKRVVEPLKPSPSGQVLRRKLSEETSLEERGSSRGRSGGEKQLRQLRDILESQLRSCADCFRALLGPGEGPLAELRPRLDRLLELREEEDEERTEQLEDSLAGLQGLIGEAIGYGRSELRQSLDFGELRQRLSDIRTSQRHLQQELRKLARPRPLQCHSR